MSFRMEVIRAEQAEKAVNEERPEEERVEAASLDGIAHAAQLADSLLQAYCVLAEAPVDIFGIEGSEATPQGRYSLMGALLAAKDVADEDLERLVAGVDEGDAEEPAGDVDITGHHKEHARRGY